MNKTKIAFALCTVVALVLVLSGPGFSEEIAKKNEATPAEALEKININTASIDELTQLKRIGTKYAERIVEFREKEPFKTPEDIMRVKGIGMKVYELNKDVIVVE